jgi:uncharacterized protein YggU (UPF0235/DUF167 family)
MVALEPHPDGTLLPVRAHAGARRNALGGCQDGCLKVSVTQSAEKGKANKALIAVLCDTLGLRRSQVELVAGAAIPRKKFLVRGIASTELQSRITAALNEAS